MLHVLAVIELNPDCRDAFLGEFHRIVPTVRAEDGCLEYGPAVDLETDIAAQSLLGTDSVCVVERWENVEALKAHLAAPHMAAYRERVGEYVKDVRLHILQPA